MTPGISTASPKRKNAPPNLENSREAVPDISPHGQPQTAKARRAVYPSGRQSVRQTQAAVLTLVTLLLRPLSKFSSLFRSLLR